MNRSTQPVEMKTKLYICGVDVLDCDDAWALFNASAKVDVASVVSLLKKDRRFLNAQYWYQFPIHRAVEAGHVEVVRILLENGSDPGQSRYTYDSWNKLLLKAQQLEHREIEILLRRSMEQRFHYHPDFECFKNAIISRDANAIQQVLKQHPHFTTTSDAFDNNAIHWCVIT